MGKPPPVWMGLVSIRFAKIIEPLAVGASPHRTILLDRAGVRKPSTKVAFQRQVEPCQKNTGQAAQPDRQLSPQLLANETLNIGRFPDRAGVISAKPPRGTEYGI